MWTSEIVRARFVEAADILRRMPNVGGSTKTGFWPEYLYTFEDMNGWGSARLAEHREQLARRRHVSSAEVTRKEEVDRWTAELMEDDEHRATVIHWAECRALGESFRERCERTGWVPMTAYRRLARGIRVISRHLNNSGALLRVPDRKWLLQETVKSGRDSITLGIGDIDPILRSPTSLIAPGAKPTHTLTTSSAVDRFESFLKKTNAKRRRKRERRANRLAQLAKKLDPSKKCSVQP